MLNTPPVPPEDPSKKAESVVKSKSKWYEPLAMQAAYQNVPERAAHTNLLTVERVVHAGDPFAASDNADALGRQTRPRNHAWVEYFTTREVINRDGSFPFGEGFLYAGPAATPAVLCRGGGHPTGVSAAGHRGTKSEQQDAFACSLIRVGGLRCGIVAVADGVSGSGPLAARAAQIAVAEVMERLPAALVNLPSESYRRHGHAERALERVALAANLEVIRLSLCALLRQGNAKLPRRLTGLAAHCDVERGAWNLAEVERAAAELGVFVRSLYGHGLTALTTLALGLIIEDDLYTFTAGDAVIGLYRPARPAGGKFIHLTRRNQGVVDLFCQSGNPEARPDLRQNEITACLGGSAILRGNLRRYSRLLEPGDRVVGCTDGLGPRNDGGLDRFAIEEILNDANDRNPASTLVAAQVKNLDVDTYQDNVGVAVLQID